CSGTHPPTPSLYSPSLHDALPISETESRETLDEAAAVLKAIRAQADTDPEALHTAPHHAPISRPDEVKAARHPVLRYTPPEGQRSEEHTSELQSRFDLVCRLLLEK